MQCYLLFFSPRLNVPNVSRFCKNVEQLKSHLPVTCALTLCRGNTGGESSGAGLTPGRRAPGGTAAVTQTGSCVFICRHSNSKQPCFFIFPLKLACWPRVLFRGWERAEHCAGLCSNELNIGADFYRWLPSLPAAPALPPSLPRSLRNWRSCQVK